MLTKIALTLACALVSTAAVVGSVEASPPAAGASPSAVSPSAVSPSAAAVVTGTSPYDLRVGSYNVQSVTLDRNVGEQRPWWRRRAGVIANILRAKVDVIGVQEANQSYSFRSRLVDGATQFLDLRNGLNKAGGTYQVTTGASYNCVNPRASYKCVRKYRGAAGGDHILYNTRTLTLVSFGSYRFVHQKAVRPMGRFLAYAVFRVNATGQKFLFTGTHLDDPPAQWPQVVSRVNRLKGSLPVVNVGDYNLQKLDPKAGRMLTGMKANGYGEVLNEEYPVNPNPDIRAVTRVNGWVNSLNRLSRDVASFAYETRHDKTGNSIDHIFATNSLPVPEYKVSVNYDPSTLRVTGVIPSDHNMVSATITLP